MLNSQIYSEIQKIIVTLNYFKGNVLKMAVNDIPQIKEFFQFAG